MLTEVVWFKTELSVLISIILSNVAFMFLRSLSKPGTKIHYEDVRKRLPEVDTIQALNVLKDEFSNFFVPCMMVWFSYSQVYTKANAGREYLFYICIALFAEVAMAVFLLMANWKRGSEKWMAQAPKILYVLAHILYLLMPLIYLAVLVSMLSTWNTSLYGLSLVTLVGIALLRIPFYFVILRRIVFREAKSYIFKRTASQTLRQELSDNIDFSNSLDSPNATNQNMQFLANFVDENDPGPYLE